MPNKPVPWLKLWPELVDHEKFAQLSDGESWTWIKLLAKSGQQPTRGRFQSIQHAVIVTGRPKKHVERLVAVRLLDLKADGLWLHDWERWQRWYPEDTQSDDGLPPGGPQMTNGSPREGRTNGHATPSDEHAITSRSTPDEHAMNTGSARDEHVMDSPSAPDHQSMNTRSTRDQHRMNTRSTPDGLSPVPPSSLPPTPPISLPPLPPEENRDKSEENRNSVSNETGKPAPTRLRIVGHPVPKPTPGPNPVKALIDKIKALDPSVEAYGDHGFTGSKLKANPEIDLDLVAEAYVSFRHGEWPGSKMLRESGQLAWVIGDLGGYVTWRTGRLRRTEPADSRRAAMEREFGWLDRGSA